MTAYGGILDLIQYMFICGAPLTLVFIGDRTLKKIVFFSTFSVQNFVSTKSNSMADELNHYTQKQHIN